MKINNVALEKLMNKSPSNPATFEQERPKRPEQEIVSTLHRPKNDILPFFRFLQKKVFRLDKKAPAHFYTTLGVVICKHHSIGEEISFVKPGNFFLQKFEKCQNVIFGPM